MICSRSENSPIWIVCVELLVHVEDLILLPLGVVQEPLFVLFTKCLDGDCSSDETESWAEKIKNKPFSEKLKKLLVQAFL